MARMYETPTEGASVQVRAFRYTREVFEWREVPLETSRNSDYGSQTNVP